MEIPHNISALYKHWNYHIYSDIPITIKKGYFDQRLLGKVFCFVEERMKIWEKKITGSSRPYSEDPIFQKYRFCNIYRELDKQTIQFHSLLNGCCDNFPLWLLNMMYCRIVCNFNTINSCGLLSFNARENNAVYEKLLIMKGPKYGTAYVFPISVIMKSEYPTRESFIAFYLPRIIQDCADTISSFKRASVTDILDAIIPIFGFNLKFHWTEVLIDTAYQYPEYIDLFKRFPIGVGSKPTMNLLNKNQNPEDVCLGLSSLHFDSTNLLQYRGHTVKLSAENWEGVGCEFRKYMNLKSGVGRRRLYSFDIPKTDASEILPDSCVKIV